MNHFQQTLFDDLTSLTDNSEAFYYTDIEADGVTYRIFNYRLASYTDFLNRNALECRGHMFEIDSNGEAVRLASLPMEKFFNINENPFTMDLDFDQIVEVMLKADGSLISTYTHLGSLRLKSKGALFSDQAIDSLNWLAQDVNVEFYYELSELTNRFNYTVNLEWTSPFNRIVIGYDCSKLTVLNIRDNITGQYINKEQIKDNFPVTYAHWIDVITDIDDIDSFIRDASETVGIEGYVVKFSDGMHAKLKTNWYLTQHRAKDSINSDRRLFEAVLSESTDDLKSLFHGFDEVINRIEKMEEFVTHKYNHLVTVVEEFHEAHKRLDRREYAIAGQQQLTKFEFSIAMMKYLDKPFSYKEMMKKRWKSYVSDKD